VGLRLCSQRHFNGFSSAEATNDPASQGEDSQADKLEIKVRSGVGRKHPVQRGPA